MNIEDVLAIFKREFYPIIEKFKTYTLSVEQAKASSERFVYHPGVYVFWKEGKVFKVGRSLDNSRKRSLEHLSDDTGGVMKSFENDVNVRLILFNCIEPEDYHWTAAVEMYLEKKLNPVVRSKRTG